VGRNSPNIAPREKEKKFAGAKFKNLSQSRMKTENIPQFLVAHSQQNLIVEFDDGDRYPARVLDMVGPADEGEEFEIRVWFKDCLKKSAARARAAAAGTKRSPPGCWWTSETPAEPVGMSYLLHQIKSIYDEDGKFSYYERGDSSR
jgi:hypothetical protein